MHRWPSVSVALVLSGLAVATACGEGFTASDPENRKTVKRGVATTRGRAPEERGGAVRDRAVAAERPARLETAEARAVELEREEARAKQVMRVRVAASATEVRAVLAWAVRAREWEAEGTAEVAVRRRAPGPAEALAGSRAALPAQSELVERAGCPEATARQAFPERAVAGEQADPPVRAR